MKIQHKIDYSIGVIQRAEPLALSMHPDGFHLAFSGGKDSIVLHELARMSGVKFKAHMQLTTIDPPEVLRYVRKYYPDVELHRPEMSFYELIKKKKMLPLRRARYCCAYLKEQAGTGKCTLLGIRREESVRRSKRNEVEMSNHKYSNSLDQFNIDREMGHVCIKGKDKLFISPIFHWSTAAVWTFIHDKHLPYCELYDFGYTRIGCVFCPMANPRTKNIDRQRCPAIERAVKRSIQYLVDNHNYFNNYNATTDEIFDWWLSNKSARQYFSDLRKQTKISF